MPNLKNPSEAILEHNINKLEDNYIQQEKAINFLFNTYPSNSNMEHVMIKVSTLNDFYSTNIFSTYTMAKHIFDNHEDIDRKLKQLGYSAIGQITIVKMGKGKNIKNKNFYSFATKYCAHHNEDFPIYDSFVAKMLMEYSKQDKFEKFTWQDLRNYNRFVEILYSFKKYYQLARYSYREIDIFLWDYGKEKENRHTV